MSSSPPNSAIPATSATAAAAVATTEALNAPGPVQRISPATESVASPVLSSIIPPVSSLPNFDPRKVPLLGVDAHLPAISALAQSPQALRQRFATPPIWTPEVMAERRFAPARAPARASVLIAIVMRAEPMVVLTERTAHLSTHSGQVAFPGGKADAEDASPVATALREAQEEVGLDPSMVEVLGSLPLYETGSAFLITPVVGLVRPDSQFTPNPGEVADLFEVPLSFLLNPAHHERHLLDWQGLRREWFAMPYQDGPHERYIWGATAGMLRNLYRFLLA